MGRRSKTPRSAEHPLHVDAIPALTTEKSIAMFEHFHVFTKTELESRTEVKYETYAKEINVEARAMIDIAAKQIIPAVIKYAKHLLTPSSPSRPSRVWT